MQNNSKTMPIMNDQHFLVDKRIIRLIVDDAGLNNRDTVLEIGGGSGSISAEIAKRCKKLTIIEKDAKLCSILANRFLGNGDISIINGDVLDIEIPRFNKIVSSMPYSIIQQFFVRLIKEKKHMFDSAVLVVPYSFAKRMAARTDSVYFGAVSAMFGAFYDVEELFQIGKSSFDPKPRVTSACVVIKPKEKYQKCDLVMQSLFLSNQGKLGNAIMRYFWNSGNTKNNARKMADGVLEKLPKPVAEKKILELTNNDFKDIASALKS